MSNLIEKFDNFSQASTFSLYDKNHPLNIFIGIDSRKRYTLIFRTKFEIPIYKKTLGIDINSLEDKGQWILGLYLSDLSLKQIFLKVCEDIIEYTSIAPNEKEGSRLFINRLNQWMRLLKITGNKKANEVEIRGLLGELVFMAKYMIPQYGTSRSIYSWTGVEKTKKDFSIDDTWFEIKTISIGKNIVTISSIEQLDSDNYGKLVIVELEKMSKEYKGIGLKEIIDEIMHMLNQIEQDVFISKLSEFGYDFFDDYSNYMYNIDKMKIYLVDDFFPKILKQSIPKEVVSCIYELEISQLKPYLSEEICL